MPFSHLVLVLGYMPPIEYGVIGCHYANPKPFIHKPVKIGNGKIHHTPHPVGLRKIKRVSLEVFLRLKEFVNSIRVITPRGNRKKTILKLGNPVIATQNCTYDYEPSNMIYVQDSPLWQWRRVAQWDRYINDPYENIKSGHMIT